MFAIIAALFFIEVSLASPETSLTVFYLIPVALTIWMLGPREGVIAAIVSALIVVGIHVSYIERLSNPFSHYWHIVVEIVNIFIITYILIELKTTMEREANFSRTDFTTGVANGRYFYEIADLELNRVRRYAQPLTVMYMDIDDFKGINDRFGHSAGDLVLRLVARVMKKNIRAIDTAARLGGDEFSVILPNTDAREAEEVVRRIQNNLRETMKAHDWKVTLSIGVATYLHPPASSDEMVKTIDRLMYSVKASGKNNMRHEIIEGATSRTTGKVP
jgi:diguanylate cyclase (GGDEF)-like protein